MTNESIRDPGVLMLQAFIPPVWLAGCTCTTSKCAFSTLCYILFVSCRNGHSFSSPPFFYFPLQNSAWQSCCRESLNSQTKQVRFEPILDWKGGFIIKSSQFGDAGHQQLSVHSFSKVMVSRHTLSSQTRKQFSKVIKIKMLFLSVKFCDPEKNSVMEETDF